MRDNHELIATLRIEPAAQAYALTGNWTMTSWSWVNTQPLSHTGEATLPCKWRRRCMCPIHTPSCAILLLSHPNHIRASPLISSYKGSNWGFQVYVTYSQLIWGVGRQSKLLLLQSLTPSSALTYSPRSFNGCMRTSRKDLASLKLLVLICFLSNEIASPETQHLYCLSFSM